MEVELEDDGVEGNDVRLEHDGVDGKDVWDEGGVESKGSGLPDDAWSGADSIILSTGPDFDCIGDGVGGREGDEAKVGL